MSELTTYVALCAIQTSYPEGEPQFEFRGTDPNTGEPIRRKRSRRIRPFELVDLTPAQVAELLPLNAIRPPNKAELRAGRGLRLPPTPEMGGRGGRYDSLDEVMDAIGDE